MKKLFLWVFMVGMYGTHSIYALTCDDIKRQHGVLWHAMVEEAGGAGTKELLLERMSLEHQALEEILMDVNQSHRMMLLISPLMKI